GKGEIEELCEVKDSNGNDTALIKIDAPIFSAYVGNFTSSNAFSTTTPLDEELANKEILRGIVPLTTSLSIKGSSISETHRLIEGDEKVIPVNSNSIAIGTIIQNLMDALVADVLGKLLLQGQ